MTKDEIILANKEYLFPAVFHYYKEPLVVSHAKNQYVWDADGNQYLDFFAGIVTVSVGHCNEQVNAKVHRQMDKLQHVSTVFANEPQAALGQDRWHNPAGSSPNLHQQRTEPPRRHWRRAATLGTQRSWRCAMVSRLPAMAMSLTDRAPGGWPSQAGTSRAQRLLLPPPSA